jgi:hypothetical protein
MSPLATASSTVEVTLRDGVMARYGRGRIRLWIPWAFCETDQAAASGVIVRRSSWSFSSMPRMRSSLRSRWTS